MKGLGTSNSAVAVGVDPSRKGGQVEGAKDLVRSEVEFIGQRPHVLFRGTEMRRHEEAQ